MSETLVVSDLHLGIRAGADLLRHDRPRAVLFETLQSADRVVLLGDAIELRDFPLRDALRSAEPFLRALGDALGKRELVYVPGNHDHRVVADWLSRRRHDEEPPPLQRENLIDPGASELGAAIAGWVGKPTTMTLAYPGFQVRDDVYATHGHYLDRDITIPAFEPLAARLVARISRRPVTERAGADGYEAALEPVYAFLDAIAQHAPADTGNIRSGSSTRAWKVLVGPGRPLRHRLLSGVGFPAFVAALNRAGLGPNDSKLSGVGLRRAALNAMAKAATEVGVPPGTHVLFGHTHRAGPFPGDPQEEWATSQGVTLMNTGSWVSEPTFSSDRDDSPYFPGTCVRVGDDGPPRLERLLAAADLPRD